MVPTSYAEPPGFGLYEEGAEKPWGDLINPPSTLGSSTSTAPTTPWFAQGYEPEWSDDVNPMNMYSGSTHDEYGDSVDNLWMVPGELTTSTVQTYDLNSPASAFGRGQSQTEWETTSTGGLLNQWWNGAMSSLYAGYKGATINGNNLVATLNSALEGAVGTNLPDPPASTLVTPPPPPHHHRRVKSLTPPPTSPAPPPTPAPSAAPVPLPEATPEINHKPNAMSQDRDSNRIRTHRPPSGSHGCSMCSKAHRWCRAAV